MANESDNRFFFTVCNVMYNTYQKDLLLLFFIHFTHTHWAFLVVLINNTINSYKKNETKKITQFKNRKRMCEREREIVIHKIKHELNDWQAVRNFFFFVFEISKKINKIK